MLWLRFGALYTLLLIYSHTAMSLPVAERLSHAQTSAGEYISWREHIIDDQNLSGIALRGADGLALADLDGDGYQDIVSVHEDSNHVRIAFASSNPDQWLSITLAEGELVWEVEDVDIGDMDNDGDLDIVVALESGGLLGFTNPGGNTRNPEQWTLHKPVNTLNRGSFIRVALADFNQDGRLQVIAANKGEAQASAGKKHRPSLTDYLSVLLAEPLPLSVFTPVLGGDYQAQWPEQELARLRLPINAEPIDLDGDGDLDIVGGGRGHQGLMWLENRGGNFTAHWLTFEGWWRVFQSGIPFLTGQTLAFDDINGDGRLDIVTQINLGAIGWLEQPESIQGDWKIHVLGNINPDHVAAIVFADVDGDGRRDVFVGGYSKGPRDRDAVEGGINTPLARLAWFKKMDAQGERWLRFDISRRVRGMYDEFVMLDMDGDGDLDVVGTRGNSGQFDGVFWLEQRRSAEPLNNFSTQRSVDSLQVELSGDE